MLETFLKKIEPYQKLIALIAALVTAVLLVINSFATKNELQLLRCQAIAKATAIEKGLEIDRTTKNLTDRKNDALSHGPSASLTTEITRLEQLLGILQNERSEQEKKYLEGCPKEISGGK